MELSKNELRIIGCLIEKSLTTPDQYPLSLNALTNACNQKSNRDPVMSMTETEVQNTIDELAAQGLVMNQSGATSRVAKYKHRFCNTEFGQLQLSPQELGIICVLFLRGPQTPGELRTRTNRLCEFTDVHETEQVLNQLCQPDENGKPAKVIKLAREPGKRESRYAHCFGESIVTPDDDSKDSDRTENHLGNTAQADNSNHLDKHSMESRITQLEEQVELLQLELEELRANME
ncbi:MAG: YceH family protein [Kangiellaceae bacterium]|jgi:uncharacterized protein